MSTSDSFVTQLDVALADKLRAALEDQNFQLSTPPHTFFSAKKKGIVCTLYASGKLVIQGKGAKEFVEYFLEPEILQDFSLTYSDLNLDLTARIGIDESGKGDFFGPLCIAGVFAEGEEIKELKNMGVRDSKKLSDASVLKIAEKIKKRSAHHIVKINPEKYNELYEKFGNLNLLLAWGHATVIEQLSEKTHCNRVIIDQFAAEHVVENALKRKNKSVFLTQRHRGEEDLIVAAASILARATFLDGLEKLGKAVGHKLPKGASSLTLEMGRKLVKEHGVEVLQKVGKIHFKTYLEILEKQL